MGYIVLKLSRDGSIERGETARTWREREELLAFALFLQPGFAALDVAAKLWRDLRQDQATGSGSKRKGS